MNISVQGAPIYFTIPIFGGIPISATLVITWLIMAIVTGLCLWLTHDMKVSNVSKRQAVAEFLVETARNFTVGNMGEKFAYFTPFVAALFTLSLLSNLISLVGLYSPTADLSTEAAWAVLVFALITYHKIKANGFGGYLKGFTQPIPVLTPFNILSEIATPISMACRHFGNILSGTVISALIYGALTAASYGLLGLLGSVKVVAIFLILVGGALFWFGRKKGSKKMKIPGIVLAVLGVLGLLNSLGGVFAKFPFLAVGIPAITSFYFDWFGGCIQAFIFCTLTTIFIKQAAG